MRVRETPQDSTLPSSNPPNLSVVVDALGNLVPMQSVREGGRAGL